MPLLSPHLMLDSVTQITPELLLDLGVSGIILDVDSTLAGHNDHTPYDGVIDWLSRMRSAGIKMNVLSNNNADRVSQFAGKLDLPFTANGAKPFPFGVRRAAGRMGLNPGQTVVVGDQIYTDIIAGNLAGAKTILLPVPNIRESRFFQFKRLMEKPVRKRYINKHGGIL